MQQQDCLYTLSEKKEDGSVQVSVIGSIIKCLHAPSGTQEVIRQMANAETKLITLTITEGGYNFNSATGEFISDDSTGNYGHRESGLPEDCFWLPDESS